MRYVLESGQLDASVCYLVDDFGTEIETYPSLVDWNLYMRNDVVYMMDRALYFKYGVWGSTSDQAFH